MIEERDSMPSSERDLYNDDDDDDDGVRSDDIISSRYLEENKTERTR